MRRPRDPAWVLVRQPSTSHAGQSMPSSSQQSQVHKTQKTGLISARRKQETCGRSIWASYESCCMPQQYAKRVHVPSAPSESRWLWTWSELHSQNDLVIGQLVKKCRKMLEECRWLLSPTTWRHDRQSYSQSLECVCVCCTMLHHVIFACTYT